MIFQTSALIGDTGEGGAVVEQGVSRAFAKVHNQVEQLSADAGLALKFGDFMAPLLAFIHDTKVRTPAARLPVICNRPTPNL